MKYYPVLIPTLNRYTHFKNCVESLARCTHADKTELVIGLDYPPCEKYETGYKKIKGYIPSITGFAKVTVFEHERNLGPGGNFRYLIDYCRQYYDAYISTEDDNVFAPAFLDYMDKALEMFRDDERITSIGGYNYLSAYNQGLYTCYLGKDHSAWGCGYWVHKEEKLYPRLYDIQFFRNSLHSHRQAKKIITTFPALYIMLDNAVNKNCPPADTHRATINILKFPTFEIPLYKGISKGCVHL